MNLLFCFTPTTAERETRDCLLSDSCLFSVFDADEKEDSILGSILLPSFHISMLSVDDHISRKYAFKVKYRRSTTSSSAHWVFN